MSGNPFEPADTSLGERPMTKPSEGSKEQKLDIKLVRALQKDFKELYQPQYTTNYKTKQMLINIELGIMKLDNVEAHIKAEIRKTLEKLDDELFDLGSIDWGEPTEGSVKEWGKNHADLWIPARDVHKLVQSEIDKIKSLEER